MKKQRKNRLAAHHESVKNKHSSNLSTDETFKRICKKPKKYWECKKAQLPEQMLSYQLFSSVNPKSFKKIKSALGDSPFLNFEELENNRLIVHHFPGTTRVENKGSGLFGNNCVYIKDDTQGLLYLDNHDKSFLQLGVDQILDSNVKGNVSASIENVSSDTHEGKKVNIVELTFTKPEPLIVKLWCWDDSATKDYCSEVYQQVLGCPDKLKLCNFPIDELLKFGIPLKGETCAPTSNDNISEFFLQDFKLEKIDASLFNIPKGYSDLRDKPKINKKHKYQATSRASSFRSGHVTTTRNIDKTMTNINGNATQVLANNSIALKLAQLPKTRLDSVCACLESTYGSQVASEFEQQLLDDLKFIINEISRRLSGFSGNNGSLSLDWFNQFKAHSDSLPDGDGLFCLLHDEPNPGSTDPEEQMGGKGLLDVQVERMVRSLLLDMSSSDILPVINPPGSFTLNNQLTVPPALANAIALVLSDASIDVSDRYDALSSNNQRDLRELYLLRKIGSIDLSYPETVGPVSVFNDLLNISVTNIEFDIRIDNTEIIDSLTLGDNDIHMVLKLPNASGQAFTTRTPSTLYWTILGVGTIGCIFTGAFCSLLPLVATVGTFLLLDAAFVTIELSDIEVDMRISYSPNTNGVLEPNTTFVLDMDVDVFYMSVIPTGIHQILSAVYTIVASQTNLILNTLESQLNNQFNSFIQDDLKLTYPPQFGSIPLVGLSSSASGIDEDHLYLEAELNAGLLGIINPYITQVDTNIYKPLLEFRDEFQSNPSTASLRHYKGFVLSQNFINHYIHILWREGNYNYVLSGDEAKTIVKNIKELVPGVEIYDNLHVHICPAVSPRLVLTPCGLGEDASYMTCFFDDLRLCIATGGEKDEQCVFEIQLAAKIQSELGFGGLNSKTKLLDIIKITNRFMDVYFDLSDISVEIIHPETQGYASTGECFKELDCIRLGEINFVLEEAVRWMLSSHDSSVIPRDEDASMLEQTYTFSGQFFKFVFWVRRGNLYVHVGFGGAALLLLEDGWLPIDDMDCETGKLLLDFID